MRPHPAPPASVLPDSPSRRRRSATALLTVLAMVLSSLTMLAKPAWADPPSNNNLVNAIVITGEQATVTGTTVDAGRVAGEPNHAGRPGNSSVWYRWTPPATAWTTIDLCGSSIAAVVGVYTGQVANALTEVASSSNSSSPHRCPNTQRGGVHFLAAAGTPYAIAVDDYFQDQDGTFQLTLNPAPSNDNFTDARHLPADPLANERRSPSDSGWSRFATNEQGEPVHAGSGRASVWFDWAATGNGPVAIDTCGSDFDTVLAVYTGSAVNTLSLVTENDDDAGAGCGASLSSVSFSAAIGQHYMIAVAGQSGAAGEFQLHIHGDNLVVPNDNFADATVLAGASASDLSNTMLATDDPGQPLYFPIAFPPGSDGGQSIWYRWTAPSSGPFEVDTCGAGSDTEAQTVLGVYTGSAANALTQIVAGSTALGTGRCAGTERSGLIFEAAAGTTYVFLVGGVRNGSSSLTPSQAGPVVTSVYPAGRPVNDDSDFRSHLSGQSVSVSQPTAGAGAEPNEPAHAGLPPQASVWFDWTALASSTVTIDTCGSTYDTVVAVYRGFGVQAFVPTASNDNNAAACGTTGPSSLTFEASTGSNYWIAVDGAAGATGSLQLHIAQPDPGPSGWQTLPPAVQDPPDLTFRVDVAELPNGDRLLWWTSLAPPTYEETTVQAARVTAAGVTGPVVNLTTPGEPIAAADLDVLPDGRILLYTGRAVSALVSHTEARLYAADLTPLGAPVQISDDGILVTGASAVVAPDGTVTFGWAGATYFTNFPQGYVAKVRRMAPDGTLGPIQAVNDPADDGTGNGPPDVRFGPELDIASDGAVTAVWSVTPNESAGVPQVQARRIAPDGTLGPIRVIDASGNIPVVGVAPDGTALVVYVDGDVAFDPENPLLAVRLRTDGTTSAPMNLDAPGEHGTDYRDRDMQVVFSDTGRAFVVWFRVEAIPFGGAQSTRGRFVNTDDTLGPILELSVPVLSSTNFLAFPRAAFDQWGNVTASWSSMTDDGNGYRGEARRIGPDSTMGRIVQLTPTGKNGAATDLLVDATGVPAVAHIITTPTTPFESVIGAIELIEYPVADLTVASAPASAGSATVTVTNTGPRSSVSDTAHKLTVDVTAAAGVTLTGGSGSGWACAGTAPLRCTRTSALAAGASAPGISVSFSSAGLPPGPGTATVQAGFTTDPNPANNSANVDFTPSCAGARVTVSGSGTIAGSDGDDVILGSSGADTIDGKGGKDTICAGAGNDTVIGGPGNDTVYGEDGDDTLDEQVAGNGKDVLDGGAGRDTVTYAGRTAAVVVTLAGAADDGQTGEGDDVRSTEVAMGGAGADTLTGTAGNDRLVGNAGNDRLTGNAGNDELLGGAGTDTLSGGAGNDTLTGGAGNDTINGDDGDDRVDEGDSTGINGADKINGGNGTDEVSYLGRSAGVIVTLGSGANDGQVLENDAIDKVETVIGTAFADALTGTTGNDRLVGGGGADALSGGNGNDVLIGGAGVDALLGGGGNDTLDGQDGSPLDVLNGGAGTDTATSDTGDVLISVP